MTDTRPTPDVLRAKLAVAIRLFQGWLQSENGHPRSWPTEDTMDAAELAMLMSEAAGCKAEYLASLVTVPAMSVTVTNLDLPLTRKAKAKKAKVPA